MSAALTVLDASSKALVRCDRCSKCCREGGPICVLGSEVARLQQLGVPVFRYGEHTFVQRLSDGRCAALNPDTGRCSIYEARPASCKLFPLDIFRDADGQFDWVLFGYCPPDQRRRPGADPASPSDKEIALAIAARIEETVPKETLQEIADSTVAAGELDIFEPHRADAVCVRAVGKLPDPT